MTSIELMGERRKVGCRRLVASATTKVTRADSRPFTTGELETFFTIG